MNTVNAAANVAKGFAELFRAGAEAESKQVQGLIEDFGKAGEKLAEGDVAGAAVEMMDAGSVGSMVARALSAHGVVPSDDVTKNLISGALNALMMNPIAVKDFADVGKALGKTKGNAAGKTAAATSHTCPRPSSDLARRGGVRARGHVSRPRGGTANEQMQAMLSDIQKLLKELVAKGGVDSKLPSLGDGLREHSRGESEVSKLGPNATFEDLVAAFMIDVMKDQQHEVKEKLDKLKEMNEAKKKEKEFDKALGPIKQIAGMVAGMHPIGFVGMAALDQVTGVAKKGLGAEADEDSRQLLFEQLKDQMQKMQQMMQSLSNVLNVMHQGAMNSIRNIK